MGGGVSLTGVAVGDGGTMMVAAVAGGARLVGVKVGRGVRVGNN
jgi:hypothetical protein